MGEQTTHIRAYESDKKMLAKTYKGNSPQSISRLLHDRWDQSKHIPEFRERNSGSVYIHCTECGRSENTVEELDRRPCKDGISVKE